MPSIFLCHSSKDKYFVRMLAERMRRFGIRVWLDEAEINIGDSLIEKIGQAIEESDFVGVVLSSNSVNSEWVQRELQLALQKELEEENMVVLPLLLEQVQIPPFLRGKFYADFTTPAKFEESFLQLRRSLRVPEGRRKKPLLVVEQLWSHTKAEVYFLVVSAARAVAEGHPIDQLGDMLPKIDDVLFRLLKMDGDELIFAIATVSKDSSLTLFFGRTVIFKPELGYQLEGKLFGELDNAQDKGWLAPDVFGSNGVSEPMMFRLSSDTIATFSNDFGLIEAFRLGG